MAFIKLLTTLLLVLLASPAWGQTVRVNGLTGNTDGSAGGVGQPPLYSSVSAAIADNPSPSMAIPLVILVDGMSSGGTIIPYDESTPSSNPFLPTANPESYPIEIPSNTLIRASGSGTAVFASTLPMQTLFETPPTLTSDYEAWVRGINVWGADVGFNVRNTSNFELTFILQECSMSNCLTGLAATAIDGPAILDLEIRDCWIRDFTPAGFPTPAPVPEIGISLHASEGTAPGRIDAEINNLQISGLFMGTSAIESRIIEVVASGEREEFLDASTSVPIAEVSLSLIGGEIDGARKNGGGWRTGLFAHAFSTIPISGPGDYARNYTAGFNITSSGTIFTSLEDNGIFAQVDCDARGQVSLDGMTRIEAIGDLFGTNPGSAGDGAYFLHTGGYLEANASSATVTDCLKHGVELRSVTGYGEGGCIPEFGLPDGLLMNFVDTSIYGNEGDGVHMSSGQFESLGIPIGGSVGGARYGSPGSEFHNGTGRADFSGGQGRLYRCSIYNNVGNGVSTTVDGHGTANLRIIRSLLWNNAAGGWLTTINSDDNRVALPILYSTLAGNGGLSSAGYSARVDLGPFVSQPNFTLDVANPSLGILHTKFFGTIFARQVQSLGDDFSGWLSTTGLTQLNLEYDSPPPSGVYDSSKIFAAGCRSFEEISGVPGGTQMYDWVAYDNTDVYEVSWTNPIPLWTGVSALDLRLKDFDADGYGDASDLPPGFTARPRSTVDWIGMLQEVSGAELNFVGIPGATPGIVTGTASGIETLVNKGAFNE